MGIKNLWQLLSPVGRSVSIETLSGKVLAVDASIWLTQFIKAMRDDEGKLVKNAHIIGTLRRVVKLLYHRIRPVFVFDGGAPALKGRTLALRRKLRSEGTNASLRKTAQRILASQLKKHKVALSAAKRNNAGGGRATFKPVYQSSEAIDGTVSETISESVEVMSAGASIHGSNEGGDDDDEGVDWEEGDGAGGEPLGADRDALVDPEKSRGSQVATKTQETPVVGVPATRGPTARGSEGEDTTWAVDTDEEEDGNDARGHGDGWEEVDLPEDQDIDQEVISSLPDHLKKKVIETAKRRQRMRSRAQYMPVAGDPALYSQTQLSNFLRSQRLNSKILKAHKQEDGEQEGKRIASEAGRRYIMMPAGGAGGIRGASDAPDGETRQRQTQSLRRIAGKDGGFKKWSYDRPRRGGGNGEKRGARVLKETESKDEEEEAGGFFLPTSELDDDSKETNGSFRNTRNSGSAIAAGGRSRDRVRGFNTPGGVQDVADDRPAVQSNGKGKWKCGSGEDPAHAYNDEEDSIGGDGRVMSLSSKAEAGVRADTGADDVMVSGAGARDVILAKSLQESEDRRAAVALQHQDSDEEDSDRRAVKRRKVSAESWPSGGVAGSRQRGESSGWSGRGSASSAAAAAAANRSGTRNGLKRQRGDVSSPERAELSLRATDEGPTPEVEEVEIELEIDPNDLAASAGGGGDSRPSEFWELVRPANHDDDDDDDEYNDFVDDDGDGGGVDCPVGQSSQGPTSATVPNNVALQRSVDVASRMAGWAGRVVARVLKEHHRQSGGGATAAATASHHDVAGHASTSGGSIVGGVHGSAAAMGEGTADRRRLQMVEEKIDEISFGVSKAFSSPVAYKGRWVRDGSRDGPDVIPGEAAMLESDSDGEKIREKVVGRREAVNMAATVSCEPPERRVGAGLTADCDIENRDFYSEKAEMDAEGGGAWEVKPRDAKQHDSSSISNNTSGAGVPSGEACSSGEPRGKSPGPESSPVSETADRVKTKPDANDRSPESRPHEAPGGVIESALTSEQGTEMRASVVSRDVPEREIRASNAGDDIQREADADEGARSSGFDDDDEKGSKPLTGASYDRSDTVDRDVSNDVEGRHDPVGGNEGLVEGGFASFSGGIDEMGAGNAEDVSRLVDMDEEELAAESERLRRDGNKARRDAETVTDEMKEEVMDLLKLFGVPYVIAPMEAEAQCCELERLKLVDGTVTDDSDAFAFGGRSVYKNIFNDKKFVEAYILPDLEKDLGVGTDEVVALALLLGSDYTEGVRGVGIVNAMEIINAFPLEGKGTHHGLCKFKKWIEGFDPILDQELEDLQKRGSSKEMEQLSPEMKFHLKHRSARNRRVMTRPNNNDVKWTVSEGFPSQEVINAYKNPQVDKSEEPFSWATPDVDGLRALCKRVLGWDRSQSDGLLMPMVQELAKGNFSQPRIDRYFMSYHDNRRVAVIKSKRLRSAVEDLANGSTEVMTVEGLEGSAAAKDNKTSRRKTASQSRKNYTPAVDVDMDGVTGSTPAKRSETSLRDTSKRRSNRQSIATPSESADGASEPGDFSADLRLPQGGTSTEVNRSLRSRRRRDSESVGADSSGPRPGKRRKRGEISPNGKRPPEGKRLNPRRKAAAALGGGRSVGVVGDYESQDDDGDYEISGESSSCSDGGAS